MEDVHSLLLDFLLGLSSLLPGEVEFALFSISLACC